MSSKTLFFLILLLSLSFFLHFIKLSYPSSVVFDEQWYASDAYSYFKNVYYFDTHPPLGKILIAFSGYLFGFEKPLPETNFNYRFNSQYPNIKNYLPFRFFPAFLGSLLPLLAFFITRELGVSKKASFLVGIFFLFENALLLQSRLVLLEIILVFFSLLSVFFYLKFRSQINYSKKWFLLLFCLGISLGAAISVKWTGIIILITIIFLEILRLDEEQVEKKEALFPFLRKLKKTLISLFIFLILVPFLTYLFSFFIHFSLINFPRDTKDLTDPLLYSKEEKTTKTFSELQYKEPEGNFLTKFIKLNKNMTGVLNITKEHPYSSVFFKWPFGEKPILYYWKDNSRLYLMGNSFVWFCGFCGIFLFLLIPLYRKERKLSSPLFFKNPSILYLYLFSWLFYAGLSRTSFLYYYLTPLCFSIILFGLCFDFYTKSLNRKWKDVIFISLVILCFLWFLFYMPFTYGLPLSEKAVSLRLLIPF